MWTLVILLLSLDTSLCKACTWTYIGCIEDTSDAGWQGPTKNLTATGCLAQCNNKDYAGSLLFGDCYCNSDPLANPPWIIKNSRDCNQCASGNYLRCNIDLYKCVTGLNQLEVPSKTCDLWEQRGCYVFRKGLLVNGYTTTNPGFDDCRQMCLSTGNDHADLIPIGVGIVCQCGGTVVETGVPQNPGCNSTCGNSNEPCSNKADETFVYNCIVTTTTTTTTSTTTTTTTTTRKIIPATPLPVIDSFNPFSDNMKPADPRALSNLLTDYRTSDYPSFGVFPREYNVTLNDHGKTSKNATDVDVSVMLINLGVLQESDMSFEAELYVALSWTDTRLRFIGNSQVASSRQYFQLVSTVDQGQLWMPAIFISNAKQAKVPTVLQSNSATILLGTGTIIYRIRLIVTLSCQVNLQNFPFDVQRCPLEIALVGYNDDQVQLVWNVPDVIKKGLNITDTTPLSSARNLKMLGFELESTKLTKSAMYHCDKHGLLISTGSRLNLHLSLRREYSTFVLHTYCPTALITIATLASLWISNIQFVSARITMSVTSLLAVYSTAASIKVKLPVTRNIKLIDIWLLGCQAVIVTVLVETVVAYMIQKGVFMMKNQLQPNEWPQRIFEPYSLYNLHCDEASMLATAIERRKLEVVVKNEQFSNSFDKLMRFMLPSMFVIFSVVYFFFCLKLRMTVSLDETQK